MMVQCVCCPVCCRIKIDGEEISGNRCGRGYNYAKSLLQEEDDYVYGKIRIDSLMVSGLPVRTDKKVKKIYHQAILKEIFNLRAKAPINVGDVIKKNILDLGVNIVSQKRILK